MERKSCPAVRALNSRDLGVSSRSVLPAATPRARPSSGVLGDVPGEWANYQTINRYGTFFLVKGRNG